MDEKSLLIVLSLTLINIAFDNYYAEAYVGLNNGGKYLRKDYGQYSRRFLIPNEKRNSNESNNENHVEIINKNKIYDPNLNRNQINDEIVNKIRFENLEQSLYEEMYKTNWIINKIVSIPKSCFGLVERRFDKPNQYFTSLHGEKDDDSESRKFDMVTKIASLENLEQLLVSEMFKANWIINKIMNVARHCLRLDKRPIDIENDDALLNRIYDEIVNKTARLEILQGALDGKMLSIITLINNTVNIGKYCFELEKSRPEHSRRFSVPVDNENDVTLINEIYDEIANKTARLELLQRTLNRKMYKVNSILNKTINIAEYCFELEKLRPIVEKDSLIRRKRDVGQVPDKVSKNDTQTKAADEGSRRSLLQANKEKSEIQQKLLSYIDDTFGDIETKMQALNETKQRFANDTNYKIGYIMSNIDTLKVNMGNVQKEVGENKDHWSDKQILDVYDTIIKSNKALSNLLNILNLLVQQSENNIIGHKPRRPRI